MNLIFDHAINRLARSLLDYFYDNVKKEQAASASSLPVPQENQMIAAIDGLREVFQNEKRPLEVVLKLPAELDATTEACLRHLEECYPRERELVLCKARLHRLLHRIECILERHEQLTQEAIRTLRTVRIISKYTAGFIALFLLYLYVKRFHAYVFQSQMYQTLTNKRLLFGGILTAAAISIYVFTNRRQFLDQIRSIS